MIFCAFINLLQICSNLPYPISSDVKAGQNRNSNVCGVLGTSVTTSNLFKRYLGTIFK